MGAFNIIHIIHFLPKFAIIVLTLFLAIPSVACALPVAQEYRNSSFSFQKIKTVLVMPLKMPAKFSEPQLAAKVKYRWGELINMKRGAGGYAILTPDQLLKKHYAAQKISPKRWGSELQKISYINGIAPRYVDAVLTLTITDCDYISVRHPQRLASGDEYEEVKDWDEHGRITVRKELVTDRTLRPAWTENFAEAACRAELWSIKGGTHTLLYSCEVSERLGGALSGEKSPSLEKAAFGVMEHAVKRVPVK